MTPIARLLPWGSFLDDSGAVTRKEIRQWWEARRLAFNLWVGLVGVCSWPQSSNNGNRSRKNNSNDNRSSNRNGKNNRKGKDFGHRARRHEVVEQGPAGSGARGVHCARWPVREAWRRSGLAVYFRGVFPVGDIENKWVM
ncbi:MAG TPA: hypothetical protein VNW54_00905 [Granulicella sp.]|nr:hypothetical protein [Granulicella sp.]